MAMIGTAVAIAGGAFSVGSFYHAELARIEGLTVALKSDIAGTAAALKADMAGVMKEVDAKVSGAKDEVKATVAGSEKSIDAKIAGFKEAADLKVSALPTCARTCLVISPAFLCTHPPHPPPFSQYKK